MFFQNKHRKQVVEILNYLRKEHRYQRDILNPEDRKQLETAIEEIQKLRDHPPAAEQLESEIEQFAKRHKRFLEATPERSWRENVEIFFVALVIALGVRAYFLQPFKIPTHSMKPTLYGILAEPRTGDKPNPVVQIKDFLLFGQTYHRLVANQSGVIERIQEGKVIAGMVRTDFWIQGQHQSIHLPITKIREAYPDFPDGFLGRAVSQGEEVLNLSVFTGDHVFVNKMTYHFKKPHRGDVIVFTTRGISMIERQNRAENIIGSQYYIKRCTGVPGDKLRIDPPWLYANGSLVQDVPAFHKIYSCKDGYRGYVNRGMFPTPSDSIQVPTDHYWAMGDNSMNSLDSRTWGGVPRNNLVGSALLVYWPFGSRWGWIK